MKGVFISLAFLLSLTIINASLNPDNNFLTKSKAAALRPHNLVAYRQKYTTSDSEDDIPAEQEISASEEPRKPLFDLNSAFAEIQVINVDNLLETLRRDSDVQSVVVPDPKYMLDDDDMTIISCSDLDIMNNPEDYATDSDYESLSGDNLI